MYPIICKIGPFTIYSYGLMIAIAFMLNLYLASNKAKASGFEPGEIQNLAFIILIFGIIGARLLYVGLNFNYYIKNMKEIILLQRGGLSWFGGLFLGSIAAIIYIRKKRLRPYKTLDLIIPYVALGQAIGRIGCLLNGCCYGRPSPFGIYFPAHKQVLLPTQIYASLSMLVIFLILRIMHDRPHKEGEIFFIYLILYSTKRFLIEFFRAEHKIFGFGFTIFQLISLIILLLSLCKLIFIKRSNKINERE